MAATSRRTEHRDFPAGPWSDYRAAKELDGIASGPVLHDELARSGVLLVRRGNGLQSSTQRGRTWGKASTLGGGWSKQRLCERYGDSSGPGAAEVTRDQVQAYQERPLGQCMRTDSRASIRKHSPPHGLTAVSSVRRRRPESAQLEGHIASSSGEASRDCCDAHLTRGQNGTVQDAFVRVEVRRAQAQGDHQKRRLGRPRHAPRVLEAISSPLGLLAATVERFLPAWSECSAA